LPKNHGCKGIHPVLVQPTPPKTPRTPKYPRKNPENTSHSKIMPYFLFSLVGVIIISLLLIYGGSLLGLSENMSKFFSEPSNSETSPQYASSGSPDYIPTLPSRVSPPNPIPTIKPITTSPTIKPITTLPTIKPITTLPTYTPTPFYTNVEAKPILETGSFSRSFEYVLEGNKGSIDTKLYSGVYNQILSQPAFYGCIRYDGDSSPCTTEEIRQANLKFLDESISNKYLDELVSSIKSKTSNKDDQARIAINLVQQIPYDTSRLYSTGSATRSPYEVLYDNKGDCDEKSRLLAYLLRELGYGVVLFEFSSEKHMAVGIKSPLQYSYKNSGYAFVESTRPSIPTDSQGDYVDTGKLTSTPIILQISDGSWFSSISEEYQDAITYNQFGDGETLSPEKYRQWEILMWKYGMTTSDGKTFTEDPTNKPLCDNDGILCNGECYENCGSTLIGKCTATGLVCEYPPGYCPVGGISCNNKCWERCGSNLIEKCTATGLVCEYPPGYCPAGQISCNNECWERCTGSHYQCSSKGLVCYI